MTLLATLRLTERRLEFWRGVCGCHAGALAVVVALGWLVAHLPQGAALNTASVLRGGAVVVSAGISAKLLAILAARVLYAVDAAVCARQLRRSRADDRVSA